MNASLLQTQRPRNIAVFRALQLGDMLCSIPALRALRSACPQARITLIGLPWAEAFVARYPDYLDDFLLFPGFPGLPERAPDIAAFPEFVATAQARRFDLAIQMHGSGSVTNPIVALFGAGQNAGFAPPEHADRLAFMPYPARGTEIRRLQRLVSFLGAPDSGDELEFPLAAADRDELAASGLSQGLEPGGYICLHPGARSALKCWPPERFAAVGDVLHATTGLPLVITGSATEHELGDTISEMMRAPVVNAAAPISVGALAALLRGSRLLVCNDTGVAHVAAALRIPSVVIFRASEMSRWAPLDRLLHRSVWAPAGGPADDGFNEVLQQARALLALPFPPARVPTPA